mgnify:CR=1 FL=1
MSTTISKGSETMFYTLILENESGRQLNLSETANRIMFSKIEGLSPPAGTISTSSYAGMDGSYLNITYPYRTNNTEKIAAFFEFIEDCEIPVHPIDIETAKKAAEIRAEYKNFKTMDCLQPT